MVTLFNYLETLLTDNVLGGAKVRRVVRVRNGGGEGGGGWQAKVQGGNFVTYITLHFLICCKSVIISSSL